MPGNAVPKSRFIAFVGWSVLVSGPAVADERQGSEQAAFLQSAHWVEMDFNKLDNDGDARIGPSQIIDQFVSNIAKINWNADDIIRMFDQDGDQQLSLKEFETIAASLTKPPSDESEGITSEDQDPPLVAESIDGEVVPDSEFTERVFSSSKNEHVELRSTTGQKELIAAGNLNGETVVNLQGDEIGEISGAVLNEAQNEEAIVISVGGFLGIGETELAVPVSETYTVGKQIVWLTQLQADYLKTLDAYEHDS